MLNALKELWINSLPVDPRQRKFAYVIGTLDLLALLLVAAGYSVAGLTCFGAMMVVAVIAHRMMAKWRNHTTVAK